MENSMECEPEEEERAAGQSPRPAKPAEYIPMPLLNSAYEPGHCLETARAMEDENLRGIALAEYYYFSGRPEMAAQAAEPYLTSPYLSIRLSACLVYAFANLATDHILCTRRALKELEEGFCESGEELSPQMRTIRACISAMAAILLHLPLRHEEEMPFEKMNLALLPPGLRIYACYVQAHYAYLQGDYGKSLGIVQTALGMQPDICPIPNIYLHLVATMDYVIQRRSEDAREHLILAWELARPDDLIEPFGEHHGLLGGMLEAVVKKEWPDDFRRMIEITYTFSSGWRKIHNVETGDMVADNLTTTEFSIAMLAARGWTNQEISDHMGISLHTVKFHIASILSKLNVSKRSELKKYMLR